MISRQGTLLFLLSLLISLVCAALSGSEKNTGLDWLFYDKLQSVSSFPHSNEVVIIDIDDKSLANLGRWPWPRSTHAHLLSRISGSKAVFFDVLFPELDHRSPESDFKFADAIGNHGNVFLPIYFETLGHQGMVVETPPHPLFYEPALAVGHVHIIAEKDGVVRSVYLKQGVGEAFWPHISKILDETLNPPDPNESESAASNKKNDQAASLGLVQEQMYLVPMPSKAQGLRHYSYSDVLDGGVDSSVFGNKIVMIGATAAGLGDLITTPVGQMHGVELNAWIYNAHQQELLIETLPKRELSLIVFITVFLLLIGLGRLSPLLFLVCSLLGSGIILLISAFLLLKLGVWLPPVSAIIGVVIFFPLWSWLRAESILRFLRSEIASLSAESLPNSHRERHADSIALALSYLSKLGLYDAAQKQQAPAGHRAVETLLQEKTPVDVKSFWDQLLADKINPRYAEAMSAQGVELISRTISQLSVIRENDQKNRQLIEKSLSSLQDAVCIADLLGEIIFVNQRFEQWFSPKGTARDGFTSENNEDKADSLLALLDCLTLKSGVSWTKVLSTIYQTGDVYTDEASMMEFVSETGFTHQTFYLCQVKLVSVSHQFRDTLVFTFTDISQLKAAESARSEALSFLSHDLRSPMVSVLAILSRYRESQTAGSEGLASGDIVAIETLVKKNLDYAESFLQLSKADSIVETDFVPCDIHAVLDGVYVNGLALCSPKSMELKINRCDEEAWVLGDMGLIERALGNLVSNAIKYSPDNTLITIELLKEGHDLLISVMDQGPGIADEDKESLFERYTRLATTQHQPGAGLGLHFVATVARKHHGSIAVISEQGEGARFILRLPEISEEELLV